MKLKREKLFIVIKLTRENCITNIEKNQNQQ